MELNKPGYSWLNTGFDQTDEHPVCNVNWNDAVMFCEWLSRKEGTTYRLPTEAEREYACRAGTKTTFHSGDNPEELTKYGNILDEAIHFLAPGAKVTQSRDGYVFTAPVGQFLPNDFGLYDMHGNVREWCSDWFDEKYYEVSPPSDPQGPQTGMSRVCSGGGFLSPLDTCRSSCRSKTAPKFRSCSTEFRVVRVR